MPSLTESTKARRPWHLGLTGGMGCGKSTVLGLFARRGFRVVESDALVRTMLATDESLREMMVHRWGTSVLDDEGHLSRPAIARQVFADPAELAWLESILHPRVNRCWRETLAADPAADWVVEIPLLFEKNLEKHFHLTLCVAVGRDAQQWRLAQRGFSPDQVEQRLKRQLPLNEKIRRADHVITNDGHVDFLDLQLNHLLMRLGFSNTPNNT